MGIGENALEGDAAKAVLGSLLLQCAAVQQSDWFGETDLLKIVFRDKTELWLKLPRSGSP